MKIAKSIKLRLALFCAITFCYQTAFAKTSPSLGATESQSAFVSRLKPIIITENKKILQERHFVEDFFKRYEKNDIDSTSFNALLVLAKRYKIANILEKTEYLEKIDEIPLSLALSQAALESGWGKSAVAKRSQNYFGQRNFKNANDLDTLNYAKFQDVEGAVKSYMRNLNANDAYKEFRAKRLAYSQNGQKFNGKIAVKTLKNYSENGREYVKMLSEIIAVHFAALDDSKNKSVRAYL